MSYCIAFVKTSVTIGQATNQELGEEPKWLVSDVTTQCTRLRNRGNVNHHHYIDHCCNDHRFDALLVVVSVFFLVSMKNKKKKRLQLSPCVSHYQSSQVHF